MRVSDSRLHKQYGREVRIFDFAVWERERENIVVVGSYAKFAQNPAMRTHLLDTGDKLLAEASPYDLIWDIGYRAEAIPARQPPLWCDSNLLGKGLRNVRCVFRDRAPPPTRHRPWSPQGTSPSGRDCFEIDPSTRQRLCPSDTSTATSLLGYPDSTPNVPSGHGGDFFEEVSAAHSGQHPLLLAEQGPCIVAGVVTMDDFPFTKIKIHSGLGAMQLACVTLLGAGSPQTFTNNHAFKNMKRVGAASAACKRDTPSRSWGGFGKSPPLETSAAVRLSVRFFRDDLPIASLAVWAYVVTSEAMQHDVLLGRDSWMRFQDRSYRSLAS